MDIILFKFKKISLAKTLSMQRKKRTTLIPSLERGDKITVGGDYACI
jgi:preprotein translocase subunit YajC